MDINNKILLLISPYGMTKRGELWELFIKKLDIVHSKKVLMSAGLIRSHFDNLKKEQLEKVVQEWVGTQIDSFIIEIPSEQDLKSLKKMEEQHLVYVSSTRAKRDLNLWFQEYLI